jgi:predicted transcriptional regulator
MRRGERDVSLRRLAAEPGGRMHFMTTREKAHKLLDELPESEIEPVVEFIASRREDPVIATFHTAPEDDEPFTTEEKAAVREAEEDFAAGRTVSHEEMLRKYG